jgi:hypothetical protein
MENEKNELLLSDLSDLFAALAALEFSPAFQRRERRDEPRVASATTEFSRR